MKQQTVFFYSDASEWGGHEILSAQIAHILANHGWDVHFIHFRPEFPAALGPKVHTYPLSFHTQTPFPIIRDRLSFVHKTLRELLLHLKPSKLVVCQGNIERGTVAIDVCHQMKIPVISYIPMGFTQAESFATLGGLRDALANRIYPKVSAWITISPFQEQLLRRFIPREIPISLIPIPLDSDTIEAPHPPQNPLRVFILGRIYFGQKRQDLIPKVARILKSQRFPVHFHIIGEGPHKAKLLQLIKENDVENEVTYHPHQSKKQIIDVLKNQCDILLIPSRFEGGPTVLFEALQLGTPILMAQEPYMEHYQFPDWMFFDGNDATNCATRIMEFSHHYSSNQYAVIQQQLCQPRVPQAFIASILNVFHKLI